MELTREQENSNRTKAAAGTAVIMTLLLLFLILFEIITPNPPFPESGGGGGQQLALGMMNMGNDKIDYSSMGSVKDVVVEKTPEPEEKIVTVEGGEDVPVPEEKPIVREDKVVIKPVKPKPVEKVVEKPKELTAAEKLREKYKKNKGKDGGGVGNNEQAGNAGSPDGDPFGSGDGGNGTGSGGGDGEGTGPGSGPGSGGGRGGGIGIDLRGRAVVVPPRLPSDTKEEGKVVVEILVDKEGNVIEANPNGRGTTTSSPALKAKARQAALATKFNVSGKFEEQKGTITIIFSFN
jgi:colicin import membrane protein